MNDLNTIIIFEKNKDGLEIKNFDVVKEAISKEVSKKYQSFEIQNPADYKKAKENRAELNKIAKEINDNKIQFVKDLTEKVQEQTKAIIDILKAKASEFDEKAKAYEGKEPKAKAIKQIVINCYTESEVESIVARLPKKCDYKIKIVPERGN